VPAGIANTRFGLLQRNKKTSVFASCSIFARAPTPDVASSPARPPRTIRCAARSRGSSRETIRLLENIDEIWVFSESAALTAASSEVALRRASDREQRGRRCVKHVKRLLKKNLA
jgi:hypothetical protein